MRRVRTIFGTVLAAGLVCALPASASAAAVTAKTTKGGSCTFETIGSRAGEAITYGGRVTACSAKFGFRTVNGQGLLYEEITGPLVDVTQSGQGLPPYERTTTYTEAHEDEPYRVRWDARVVLRTRKSVRRPKRPERWIDPGRGCRVATAEHFSDMIVCQVQEILPPVAAP